MISLKTVAVAAAVMMGRVERVNLVRAMVTGVKRFE